MISKGVKFMFIAVLLFSFMQLFVKLLDTLPFFELIFFRALISAVLCYSEIKYRGIPPLGNDKKTLILRGVFGVASLSCFFYALHHVPLATVITLVNIKPFLVLVVAGILLGEKVTARQWLFFAVSFAGIFIVKGFDNRFTGLGLACTVGAALFAAFAHTFVRKLRTTDVPVVILFYFTLVTVPVMTPLTILNWQTPTGVEWLMILAMGLSTHVAQLFLTKAYQQESVGNVSNMYYLGIVYAFGFGFFFFDETFTWQVGLGLSLVLVGIFLNIFFVKKTA